MLLFQAFQQPLIGNGLGGNNASQLSEISEEIDAHDMKFAFIQQGVNLPGGADHLPLDSKLERRDHRQTRDSPNPGGAVNAFST